MEASFGNIFVICVCRELAVDIGVFDVFWKTKRYRSEAEDGQWTNIKLLDDCESLPVDSVQSPENLLASFACQSAQSESFL